MTLNKRAYPYIASLATALVIFTVVAFISVIEKNRFGEEKRAEVLRQLSFLRARLEGALNSRLYLTQSVAAYIATHPDIGQRDFEQLARELVRQDSVINTMALSKNSIISHLYPLRGHESALGLNLMAHPERKAIVEKTIKNRKGFVAGPVELVEGGTAFISYTPVFLAVPYGNLKAGDFWGITDITIMMENLFKEAGLYYDSLALSIAIRGKDGMGEKGEVFWGDKTVLQANPVRLSVTLPNGYWEMAAVPKGGWSYASPFFLALWSGGIVMTVAGGLFAFLLVRTPLRLKELVAQATESLSENEKKYRELVENANSIILKLDANGNITFFNEFAQDFFGYKEHEIVGRSCIGTIVPPSDSNHRDLSEMIRDICVNPWKYAINENENIKKSGERVWISWTNKGIYEDGRLTGVLCIGNDITMFKKAEQELQRYRDELEDMVKERTGELAAANRELRRMSAYKSEYLAAMSHEIRTPMNAIIGMTDLALDTDLTAEQKGYLDTLKHSADSLLCLLNDILDLSKIEAGRIELEEIGFDMNKLIKDTIDIMTIQAVNKGLNMSYSISREVPAYLKGDPARLRQIIINLIGNAIKFTEKGEVILSVGNEEENSPAHAPSLITLRFSVRDTGIGIPEDKLDSIFDSFTQIDRSTTRKYGGTGLGLSISKRLVEMMGGKIWAESGQGKGSAFHFTARFIRGGLEDIAMRDSSAETAFASSIKILIVEDNIVNQIVAKKMLEKMGHKAVIANNGKEAIELLGREDFDIVLMDVQMPEMDGLTATRLIRDPSSLVRNHAVPVIALTADAMKGDRERCIEAGMNDYASKPFNRNELMAKISGLVPPHRRS